MIMFQLFILIFFKISIKYIPNNLKMLTKILVAYNVAAVFAAEPNPPTWDTNHVKIFTPGQPDAQA
jgi:hypothetical protein